MKKISIITLALVLTLSILTACGCRNSKPMNTTPTTMPTTTPTIATTEATTAPTQATKPTSPTGSTQNTDSTIDNGNGPLTTEETGTPGANDRTRRVPGGR